MTIYVKSLHPLVLEGWLAEVDALPNRKKSKWSALAKNPQGVWHKYRYNEGHFEIKFDAAVAKQFGRVMTYPTDGWAPVVPLRGTATFEQIERAYGSQHAKTYTENLHSSMYAGRLEQTDEQAVSPAGLVQQHNAVVEAIAANHTGQHHRNHTITVPTAPGQPVRG